jgi:hypothetical protein
MQLDSSIDQRLKELEDVNHEIQGLRTVGDQEYEMTQQNYYELLALKMDKSKALYDSDNQAMRAKGFQDVATGRFRSQLENEN